MKNIFTFGARVLLAMLFLVLGSGCGGGGSKDPVVPQLPPVEQSVYRLQVVLDEDILYGGAVVNDVQINQGTQRRFWVRLEARRGDDPWTIVTQQVQLDVTIEGANSGDWMADVGLTGGQSWALAGQSRLEFQPPIGGHLGTAKLKLSVPEFGAFVHLWVTIVAPVVGPPQAQTCRELHPNREAIDGSWWDCVGGIWSDTGEPMDQPPPSGELHAFGAQGELRNGGSIAIEEGNGYRLEFFVGDSKVTNVTFESPILPSWCWDSLRSEVMTVLWINPAAPDPNEPGNIFINPGSYPATFHYDGKSLAVTIIVTDRVDFP